MDARLPDAVATIAGRLKGLPVEQLLVLMFDDEGHYLEELTISSGLKALIRGRFREIVQAALAVGARHLLLAHNHPSHSTKPSCADIKFTRNLMLICAALEIAIIDHLIIAGPWVTSMRKADLL